MSFLDSQLNDLKNKLTGAFNPFEEQGGLGGLLNSALGSITDTVGSFADIFKPQFETKQAAEDSLFNSQPASVPRGTIYDSSIQDASNSRSYGDPLHIRNFVRDEFANREHDFGLYYTHGTNGEAIDGPMSEISTDYTGEIYRGPRTAWSRITSNASYTNPTDGTKYEGFVMNGVTGFADTYGFNTLGREDSTHIVGYDVSGKPHVMTDSRFKHRPCPGLTGIESAIRDIKHNGRLTTVSFVCWSRAQLDYLEPYFFAPGMSVVLEWGWNNYPRDALVSLEPGLSKMAKEWRGKPDTEGVTQSSGLVALMSDPEFGSKVIENGKGNYYATVGRITRFEYAIRDDGGYDCTIEVKNTGDLGKDQLTINGTISCDQNTKDDVVENAEDTSEKLKENTYDFKDFIGEGITSYLSDGILSDNDYSSSWLSGSRNYLEGGKQEFTQGRYFTPDTLSAKSGYEFGFSSKSSYITFGLFIDFVNDFFAKEVTSSTGSTNDLFRFECEDTRITAHPNIKSNNGSVLLIPNSTSPRRNDKTNTAIETQIISSNRGISSKELSQAMMGNSGTGKVESLAEALKKFPRDDLYEILSAQAVAMGNERARPAWKSHETTSAGHYIDTITEQTVKPFPDYAPNSAGYSGRLKDLYVNIETIRQSVNTANTVKDFTLDILKKMSQSVGGIWDFNFVSADASSPNSPITAIIDSNYGGPNPVGDIAKSGQTYIFKSHQKNSIIKNLSLSVDMSAEMASAVIGSTNASDQSKETRLFSSSNAIDRVFSIVEKNTGCRDAKKTRESFKKSDIEDPEKYIVRKTIVDPNWMSGDEEFLIELADTRLQRVLSSMRDDNNPKNNVNFNGPNQNVKIEIQLLGIAGLRALETFQCTGIPTSYYERGHFRITDIQDSLSGGDWVTTITGLFYFNSAEAR